MKYKDLVPYGRPSEPLDMTIGEEAAVTAVLLGMMVLSLLGVWKAVELIIAIV